MEGLKCLVMDRRQVPFGINEVDDSLIALSVICSTESIIGKLAISPEFNQGISPFQKCIFFVEGVPPSSTFKISPITLTSHLSGISCFNSLLYTILPPDDL